MNRKSCFDCKNAVVVQGDASVGIGGICIDNCHAQLTEDQMEACEDCDWIEYKCPAKCGHFEHIMVEVCAECKKEMNTPLHEVEYYGVEYVDIPVCSVECKIKFDETVGKKIKEY